MGFDSQELIETICTRMRSHATAMAGADDADGFIISGLVHILANLYDNLNAGDEHGDELSGPRVGLLIRLMEEERHGNLEGITPTMLSRNQHVSRNTISALLRGLEDQGYIERRLDPKDRRLFRIHITDTGRERVRIRAPQWIQQSNRLAANLTPAERQELIRLLGKLFVSVHDYTHQCVQQNER